MQTRKEPADVNWDMTLRCENRLLAVNVELEAMRKEFTELKSVIDARCGQPVHLESVVEKLNEENGELKRRLKMRNFGTFVSVVLVIFVSVLIMWLV